MWKPLQRTTQWTNQQFLGGAANGGQFYSFAQT